jgi:uncharacterized protein
MSIISKSRKDFMKDINKKEFNFSWKDLGNVELGRPNLGNMTPVIVYRLMEYTFKDVMSKELGIEKTAELFIKAGKLAGEQFCTKLLDTTLTFDEFIAQFQEKLIELKIGILRIEASDIEKLNITLSISEDLDCSGLPVFGETVCDYDEGFLEGVFSTYTGKQLKVKEIDCWATGDRTCRFTIVSQ